MFFVITVGVVATFLSFVSELFKKLDRIYELLREMEGRR